MKTSNDPIEILTNQTENIQPVNESANINDTEDDPQDDFSIKSREVWRPYDAIKPKDGEAVIVCTRNSSYFMCRVKDGRPVRHIHGVDIPVAEPKCWIYAPYREIIRYLNNGYNKDVPMEVAFAWLLRSKHALEAEVKELSSHPDGHPDGYIKEINTLRASFQRSESNNANLISNNTKLSDENRELQDLIAQRNDELTKADDDLEKCYAEIADLKHQLLTPSLSKDESLELSRLRMQTQLDERDKTKLVSKISNLENTINQLRENAVKREEELGCRIESLQNQLSQSPSKEYEDRIADLERQLKIAQQAFLAKVDIIAKKDEQITGLRNDIQKRDEKIEKQRGALVGCNETIRKLKEEPKPKPAPVIPKVGSNPIEWIAKYNALSTRYTRLLRFIESTLNAINLNKDNRDAIFNNIVDAENTLFNFKNEKPSSLAQPISDATPVQSSTSALPTPPVEEKPRPRMIHIPRVNFLNLPHVGNATITIITPLLARFNVIID